MTLIKSDLLNAALKASSSIPWRLVHHGICSLAHLTFALKITGRGGFQGLSLHTLARVLLCTTFLTRYLTHLAGLIALSTRGQVISLEHGVLCLYPPISAFNIDYQLCSVYHVSRELHQKYWRAFALSSRYKVLFAIVSRSSGLFMFPRNSRAMSRFKSAVRSASL